jgi:putative transposase
MWPAVAPASARPPCRTSAGGGSARSPWRSPATARPRPRPESVIGVDLGITSLAVLSTGETVPYPRHLEVALRELRRLQRQASRRHGPDRRTRRQPSRRWRRTQARIATLHTAVANARRDGAQAHDPTRARARHDRDRGPPRRRDAAQPAAGPARRRRRDGQTPPPDRVQNRLGRQHRASRGAVVPVVQDLFGLWCGENQAAPVRTDLPLRRVRTRARSRSQRRPQPRRTCRAGHRWHVLPESRGDGKRARWKPAPDPHRVGSGYRHGKAPRSTPGRKATAT